MQESTSVSADSSMQKAIEELNGIDVHNCDYYLTPTNFTAGDASSSFSSSSHSMDHLVKEKCQTPTTPTSPKPKANFATEPAASTIIKESKKKSSVASHKKSGTGSRTSHSSNSLFAIRMCCGTTLKLSSFKLVNLTSLTANLLGFIALLTVIIVGYVGSNNLLTSISNMDLDTSYYRDMMVYTCRSAVYANNNKTVALGYANLYGNYSTKFNTEINNMLAYMPNELRYSVKHNITIYDMKTVKAMSVERQAISMVKAGNFTAAMNLIGSDTYQDYLPWYEVEFKPSVDYFKALEVSYRDFSTTMTTLQLIIVCVSIVIVIPVVIMSLAFSMNSDNANNKRLKKANAYMLMDTMRDNKLRKLFKEYCKQEMSLENYLLLDKITDYKILCEKSFEIQVFLYDDQELTVAFSDAISDTGSTSTSMSSDSQGKKKKKKGYTERDLIEIEKKKYEVAFEIFTDFLDVNGDKSVNINKHAADKVKTQLDLFASGENEHLSDMIFDPVEGEVCILMLDTHHRFKQTVEFQKKTKKESLKIKLPTVRKSKKAQDSKSGLNLDSLKVPSNK
ncbi:predicted protein [Naegleria gruberi]|uniref:Predicted protein n=1 Tax=Naegleria gruberi TaxID=5762 RepID=D2VNN6_NAEGR|nr:uncharacterized protein NAEGRDRAFT_51041 [Naegleria gruberi]EFC41533.1 predicted protein [Naegleria gruberi]|eukprot:XP_002674277.1 predicted protein [Naegleria gruberi strain NEG-M]